MIYVGPWQKHTKSKGKYFFLKEDIARVPADELVFHFLGEVSFVFGRPFIHLLFYLLTL